MQLAQAPIFAADSWSECLWAATSIIWRYSVTVQLDAQLTSFIAAYHRHTGHFFDCAQFRHNDSILCKPAGSNSHSRCCDDLQHAYTSLLSMHVRTANLNMRTCVHFTCMAIGIEATKITTQIAIARRADVSRASKLHRMTITQTVESASNIVLTLNNTTWKRPSWFVRSTKAAMTPRKI